MIGMGDRTYCMSPNCTNKCGRKLTDEEHLRYTKQWGNENYPLAMSYFCGEPEESVFNDSSKSDTIQKR